jgi:hypothetical protein
MKQALKAHTVLPNVWRGADRDNLIAQSRRRFARRREKVERSIERML